MGISDGPADPAAVADAADAADAAIDQDPAQGRAPEGATAIGHDGQPHRSSYGKAGRPLNRQSPVYVGFFGALGVLLAVGLWHMVGQLAQVITLLVVALFITLALNPIVEALVRRDLRRSLAVATVFVGLVAVFVSLGLIVVPPVVQQGTLLAENAPTYLNGVLNNRLVRDLDTHYQVADKLQAELQNRVTDGNFMSGIAGGVLGAGKAVLSGFFSFFTVLVLTLYFLSSLPKVKQAAYGMVPASRRPRVDLAVGGDHAAGRQLRHRSGRRRGDQRHGELDHDDRSSGSRTPRCSRSRSASSGCCPWSAPRSARRWSARSRVFDEPRKAVIALIYYVVYQQIENYVIAPRIMQRTVSVPGAMTVVAALAGAALLGMLGALLAIPVAAGLLLLYEEVLVPRQRRA